MHVRDRLYVGGTWLAPSGAGALDVVNPATEEVMGRVPEGTPDDVERAVGAARAAFEGWSETPVPDRAQVVRHLHEGLTARIEEVARLVAEEVGTPLAMATLAQATLPAVVAGSYAEALGELELEETIGTSLVVREPVGVVACITPWNFPLHLAVTKVVAALAVGCTVVLKPSELAPLTAFVLAEVAHQAGVPPGVLNLVTGTGPTAGEALVGHPGVDMVSFTGSTATGRRVAALAAPTVKRLALELGGKSANVVLDDADLEEAVRAGVRQCFLNSGQSCLAWSRLLVPRDRHDEAAGLAGRVAEGLSVGDPFGDVDLGPLVSEAQRARVRAFVEGAVDEGARLVTGGPEPPEGLSRGYYVRPTVFAGVASAMTIAQQEVFGPVLAVLAYDDEDDAVRIANDTVYGLHGAVFSGDPDRARRVARRLRTGQVDLGGGGFNPVAPMGGCRQSGYGRELGRHGLEEFLQVKSIQR